jgi:hypothetical protein
MSGSEICGNDLWTARSVLAEEGESCSVKLQAERFDNRRPESDVVGEHLLEFFGA